MPAQHSSYFDRIDQAAVSSSQLALSVATAPRRRNFHANERPIGGRFRCPGRLARLARRRPERGTGSLSGAVGFAPCVLRTNDRGGRRVRTSVLLSRGRSGNWPVSTRLDCQRRPRSLSAPTSVGDCLFAAVAAWFCSCRTAVAVDDQNLVLANSI